MNSFYSQVSLEEGASNPADEVLQRAAGFFVDNNENYSVSWDEASHMISDAGADPSRPPTRGANKEYLRWKLRRIVESIYFRATTLVLILVTWWWWWSTSRSGLVRTRD